MKSPLSASSLSRFLDETSRRGGVDYHLHSSFSDGALTPDALVQSVIEHRLFAFSLTDHDTIDGIPHVRQALSKTAQDWTVIFIAGVEMSARFDDREVHILGYFTEDRPPSLTQYLACQVKERRIRNEAMIHRLNTLGYNMRYEELSRFGGEKTLPGRVHMALWLVENGDFPNIESAFRELLGEGKPAFVYRRRHDAKEVIEVIHNSGGVSVLAHPQEYGWRDFSKHFKSLKDMGIQGIECFHGSATAEQSQLMTAIAAELSLICTAGSDSHGRDDQHASMYYG